MIRQTAGSIITTLIEKNVVRFADVLQRLLVLLDNPEQKIVLASLSALEKTCEDSSRQLSDSIPAFLSALIPKLISLFTHQSWKIRQSAIYCINQFISIQSDGLTVVIEHFVNGLYQVTIPNYLI